MPVGTERTAVIDTKDEELFSDASLGIDGGGDSATGEDLSTGETSKDVEPSTADGSEQRDTNELDFGGLPFKELNEFVGAHKSLQDAYRTSRTELYQVKQQLSQILPLIQQWQKEKTAPKAEEPVNIPKFLEAFIEGPDKAIAGIVDKIVKEQLGQFQQTQLTPVQQQFWQMQKDASVDRFLSEHREVTDAGEEKIIEVMQENPWIQQEIKSIPKQLSVAYALAVQQHPDVFTKKEVEAAAAGVESLRDMKASASGVGTKGGTRATRQVRDEFDDVLSDGGRTRWG